MPLLQAALNGDRDLPLVPRTPDELAAEARATDDAGARVLHLHPYDADGRQTFDAEPCAAAIRAVRAVCPGIPVSLSTSAEIEADPERRRSLVGAWTEPPELSWEAGVNRRSRLDLVGEPRMSWGSTDTGNRPSGGSATKPPPRRSL